MVNGGANDPPGHLVDHYDPEYNYLYPQDWNFSYPCSSFSCRPKLVVFKDCTNVKIVGVTLANSPLWTTVLVRDKGVTIDTATIYGDRRWPNNDGVDLVDCSDVVIQNSNISTGDDNIIVVGHTSTPAKNIYVFNCTLASTSAALKVSRNNIES